MQKHWQAKPRVSGLLQFFLGGGFSISNWTRAERLGEIITKNCMEHTMGYPIDSMHRSTGGLEAEEELGEAGKEGFFLGGGV